VNLDIAPYASEVWRLVEAQHRVSTLKLVDTLEEQSLLESLIEEAKPNLPPECQGLHYLLAAPFRYGAIYPDGSRFRRAGRTLGVYYASEEVETAVSEMVFYRLLFFAESPATPFPDDATDFNAFSVRIKSDRAYDITNSADAALRHLTDYSACQNIAMKAREAQVDIIRYASVRRPGRHANVAVLSAKTFADRSPKQWRTWRIKIGRGGVSALCDFPTTALSFDRDAFAADPRLADFHWNR
jgi:RES domain